MHKPKNFYWWLLSLSLVLPALELIVFSIINNGLSGLSLIVSASYIPVSIVSGGFFLYLMMSTKGRPAKRYLLLGYIVSIFATIAVSVLLQKLPSWVVSNLIGGLILMGGTFLSYLTRPRNNSFYS